MLILKIESPMTNNWEDIWNNRKITVEQELSILETLIKNDGFDTPFGFMKEKDWRDYVDSISHTLNINNKDKIFEVGCGAGAFLFPFYERNIFVSGIDISSSLISVAKKYLHTNAKFLTNKEAINVDSTEKFVCLLYIILKNVICGSSVKYKFSTPTDTNCKIPPPIFILL